MQNDPVRLGSVAVIKLLRNSKLVKHSTESNRIDFEIAGGNKQASYNFNTTNLNLQRNERKA